MAPNHGVKTRMTVAVAALIRKLSPIFFRFLSEPDRTSRQS